MTKPKLDMYTCDSCECTVMCKPSERKKLDGLCNQCASKRDGMSDNIVLNFSIMDMKTLEVHRKSTVVTRKEIDALNVSDESAIRVYAQTTASKLVSAFVDGIGKLKS